MPHRIFLGQLGAGLGLIYDAVEAFYQRLDHGPVSLYLRAHLVADVLVRYDFLNFSGPG